MTETVLVTGASGFIAGHCIIDLLNNGYHVRGSVRDPGRTGTLKTTLAKYSPNANQVEFVKAELLDAVSWQDAVAGCDAVFHVASPVPIIQPKDAQEVIAPAREGTLNVLRAAKSAGVRRVILTSSVSAVMHNARQHGDYTALDWTDLTRSDLSPYTLSKTIAERSAWDFCAAPGGPELATINPGMVLGPALESDYGSSLEVLVKLLRGEYPLLPRLGFDCVDVRDVASLHRLALEVPAAAGQRFLCGNGFLWLADIARELARSFPAFAGTISSREMPNLLTRIAAVFIKEISQFKADVDKVKRVDQAPARALGWTPRSAEQAIRDGAQSLIDLGIVQPK